jgi:DNA primase
VQDPEFSQFLERLKLLCPIEEVVGERVGALKRKGHWLEACCPFHQEKTPSFKVNPQKGNWHCFGACGEGGDAISFVQRFDGLEFLGAVELLARQAGLELPARRGSTRAAAEERFAPLYDCLERAAAAYARSLKSPSGARALEYLRARGMTPATIDAFGLGYAAEGAIAKLAREAGWSIAQLEAVGLMKRSEDGRDFEFFRNRLMIPIRERSGRVLGFGARVLGDAAGQPKYLNTGETPLFHKGRLVFGLDRALDPIRRSRRAVLVEGYTDVMAAHQAGLCNVVAVLGTAFTDEHAALLRHSGARRVTLFFDGDAAGRKATARALAGLLPLGLELDVAVPPEGQDPGDYAGRAGAAGLEALLAGATDWFAWLTGALQGRTGHELSEAVRAAVALLARLPQPVERQVRLGELARATELPLEALRQELASVERRSAGPRAATLRGGPATAATGSEPQEPRASAPVPQAAVPQTLGRAPSPVRPAPRAPVGRGHLARLLGACMADNSLIPAYEELLRDCAALEGEPSRELVQCFLELAQRDSGDEALDAARLMLALGDHPLRGALVGLEEAARLGEGPLVLARDLARQLGRLRAQSQFAAMRSALQGGAAPSSAELAPILQGLRDSLRP